MKFHFKICQIHEKEHLIITLFFLFLPHMHQLMRLFLFSAILISSLASFSQNTQIYTHDSYSFRTGLELYNKQKFTAARQYFERYLSLGKNDLLSIESEYYAADCGLQLFHADGERKLNDFVKKYNNHPKSQQALFSLGNMYRSKKDFKKAISYYSRLNTEDLAKEQQDEAQFNIGYCYLNDKQIDKALPYFNTLKGSENKFTYAASYYAGNIEFRQANYDAALPDYQKAEKNESYKTLVPYMIASIYYKQKKYDEFITYTNALTKTNPDFKNQDEIYLIQSDVYFRKQEYLKSITAADKYRFGGKELPDDAQYRYAKSYYYTGRNDKATENFKKLSSHKDSIGQFSSYFLAMTYLRDENKAFAVPLLAQALSMSYSKDVQEESLFLYGKVNYESGKLTEVISSLKEYRKKFPKGRFADEASEILSDALLNTSNYSEALDYIESLPKRSPRIDVVYQKVAFNRAEELYNQGFTDSSITYLEKSQSVPSDKKMVAEAYFLMGEAYSMKSDPKNATENYFKAQESNQFANEDFFRKADYGLGYSFYNLKAYDKSAITFKKYTDDKDMVKSNYYPDAMLRLADSYYALKKYTDALETYEKAVQANNKENDYILLQKGLINGATGNYEQADNLLYALTHNYPKSPYYETALFNKAMFSVEKGDYQNAIQAFTMFIRERQSSVYIPNALERRAICNVNLKNPDLAINDYEIILKDYPTSPVANAALQGIQEIMSREGKNEEFLTLLEEFKKSNPQKSDLENIEFESAKRLYFDQKYNESIRILNNFISSYPNSELSYEATYYLADSYYRINLFKEALPFYQKIVDINTGSYTNRSLYKIGEINYFQANYPEALKNYRLLLQSAGSKKDIANAYQGLMLSHFQSSQFDSSFAYGQVIVRSGYATSSGQNKAFLISSKSILAKGDTTKAIDLLISTINEAKDENGAEAQLIIAEIFRNQKKYKSALNELFNLNTYYSEYTKWVGKSFLSVADNYQGLGETFQAKATLESLIKNFPDQEIVDSAKVKLEAIK